MTFTIRWPEDASRLAPLPAGQVCRFVAKQAFTLELNGVKVKSTRTDDEWVAKPRLAEVTEVAEKELIWHFADGEIGRSWILPLPEVDTLTAAWSTQGAWSGVQGVLANKRGTAVQAQAAWGQVESKYDALLAANIDTAGPGDRLVALPFIGMKVVLGADQLEVGGDSVVRFECHGQRIRWWLQVKGIRFLVSLWLGKGNAIRMHWTLLSCVGADMEVRLRPMVDNRSFHSVTKAFMGAEQDFPESTRTNDLGFAFDLRRGLQLRVQSDSTFKSDPQWRYCLPLPLEASRGLEDMTDVFSPGEFIWRPLEEPTMQLTACVNGDSAPEPEEGPEPEPVPLPVAMQQSLSLFLTQRGGDLTVIAGFPWFLDWGRDSLIFCRGLIALDRGQEAGLILHKFGEFEEQGTLPNLLRGAEVTNRETSDAPLWWVVAAGEWLAAGGDPETKCGGRTMREIMCSIVGNYARGTDTGVKLDAESGLIFSPSHFSWMDTDRPSGTPRCGYPIEIQALWIAALRVVQRYDDDVQWSKLAKQAESGLEHYFWREADGFYADCLHAKAGEPAAKAKADDHLRPNQWLAIALRAVTNKEHSRRALQTAQCLLVPGAARSLAPRAVQHELPVSWEGQLLNDPQRPYWPHYTGPEDVTRKPAYHNGTAWCWLFPVFVEAMLQAHGPTSLQHARRLMSSTIVPWREGCLGQLPENMDGDLPHLQRGCGAQAWSVSEWLRVWVSIQTQLQR